MVSIEGNGTRPIIEVVQNGLSELFSDWTFVAVTETGDGRFYTPPKGFYLLSGLPGTFRFNEALFVRPHIEIRRLAEARMANGVIGAFRSVRSAHYMKQNLLPVFVSDPQRMASPLLALVSYEEHELFERPKS